MLVVDLQAPMLHHNALWHCETWKATCTREAAPENGNVLHENVGHSCFFRTELWTRGLIR
jgi:hypothetical protein